MKKIIILVLVLIAALVAGTFVLQRPSNVLKKQSREAIEQQKASTVIEITSNGFATGTLTLGKGKNVELKNSTSTEVEIASDKASFKIPAGKNYPLKLEGAEEFKFTNKKGGQVLLIIVK